jgi:hypothetical protein
VDLPNGLPNAGRKGAIPIGSEGHTATSRGG